MRRWLILEGTIFLLDQLSKFMAEQWLTLHIPIPITPWFNLTLVYNTGAAFSLLSDAGGWQNWFFAVVTVIICIILVNWLKNLDDDDIQSGVGIALILGGALGNLFDRLALGHVVDFLDLYYQGYHWPTFNIADAAITSGALLIIVAALWEKKSIEQ